MRPFDYYAPTTVSEALDLLGSIDGAARPLAGGTDLLVQMRRGDRQPDHVIPQADGVFLANLNVVQNCRFAQIKRSYKPLPICRCIEEGYVVDVLVLYLKESVGAVGVGPEQSFWGDEFFYGKSEYCNHYADCKQRVHDSINTDATGSHSCKLAMTCEAP